MSNSENASPMPRQLSFDATPEPKGKLIFSLTIPGRLPSWNEILGMEHWARYQFKERLADAFEFELRQSARDCSTTTTSQRSTTSIYLDTLVSYRETAQLRRKLRSASKKQSQGKAKKSELKSGNTEAVPF